MQHDFQTPLLEGATELGLELAAFQAQQMECYLRELFHWNAAVNLISARTTPDGAVEHVLDCLSVSPYIGSRTGPLLDLGSGGGLPGIPLKILLPELRIHLVEAARKKTSFLLQIIRKLDLVNISVSRMRAERLSEDPTFQEAFAAVISRAAFPLDDFMRKGTPFLAPEGILIAMKGPRPDDEIQQAEPLRARLNMTLLAIHDVRLPRGGGNRTVVVYGSRKEKPDSRGKPENARA